MSVKVIATDMDGTFLNSKGSYDHNRFQRILKQLQERDIRFVVASSNPYRQLREHFPDCHEQLTFVGENGANIISKNQSLVEVFQQREDIASIIYFIEEKYPQAVVVLSGEKKGYLKKGVSENIVKMLLPFFPVLELVNSFSPLPDERFFKLTLQVKEEESAQIMKAIADYKTSQRLVGTASGFGYIDIITKGLHKGWALQQLLKRWNFTGDHLMAFGDGGNDIEMLKLAKYSYAMANAPKNVKAAANYQAKSNDESGVLDVIDNYLASID